MRLLNTKTLELKEFIGAKIPDYVILSHTWGEDEVSFQDFQTGKSKERKSWDKVTGACKQAQMDGFTYIWIDTFCINKESSAELQESINSMYKWYEQSVICYAYLVDVPNVVKGWGNAFLGSRWWSRGWTLRRCFQLCLSRENRS
jgi:hypothetical protein